MTHPIFKAEWFAADKRFKIASVTRAFRFQMHGKGSSVSSVAREKGIFVFFWKLAVGPKLHNFSGLLNSVRTILGSALGIVQSRVELFSAELQGERLRFVRTILFTAAVVIIGTLALVLFTVTVIIVFWKSAGPAVLIGLTLFYSLGTVLLYRKLNTQLHKNRPLSRTIDELKKDRECLES